MAKGDVRDHLVEVGLQTFRAGGYNHTGVKDLVAAADVPKGSFYYLCWPFTPSGAGYWHFCARTARRALRME